MRKHHQQTSTNKMNHNKQDESQQQLRNSICNIGIPWLPIGDMATQEGGLKQVTFDPW